jgi:outer membrane lipoprotein LolB
VVTRLRGYWAAASLSLLICACAAVPRGPPVTVDPASVKQFELDGRINLRVQKDAYPGRVHWQHSERADELWFYSPIGSTVARLRRDETGALLVTSDGHEYRADDLRKLALEVLGWDLPIQALPYWVLGLQWPGEVAAEEQFDEHGQLKRLSQGGWQVSYLDWAPAGVKGLPSKLDLQGERLRMRLLVEQWKVDTNVQ